MNSVTLLLAAAVLGPATSGLPSHGPYLPPFEDDRPSPFEDRSHPQPPERQDGNQDFATAFVTHCLAAQGGLTDSEVEAVVKHYVRPRAHRADTLLLFCHWYQWLTGPKPNSPHLSGRQALAILHSRYSDGLAGYSSGLEDAQLGWQLHLQWSLDTGDKPDEEFIVSIRVGTTSDGRLDTGDKPDEEFISHGLFPGSDFPPPEVEWHLMTHPEDSLYHSDIEVNHHAPIHQFWATLDPVVRKINIPWELERRRRDERLRVLKECLYPSNGLIDPRSNPQQGDWYKEYTELKDEDDAWRAKFAAWRRVYDQYSLFFWETPFDQPNDDEMPHLVRDVTKRVFSRPPPRWGKQEELKHAIETICTPEALAAEQAVVVSIHKAKFTEHLLADIGRLYTASARQLEANEQFLGELDALQHTWADAMNDGRPEKPIMQTKLLLNRLGSLRTETDRLSTSLFTVGGPSGLPKPLWTYIDEMSTVHTMSKQEGDQLKPQTKEEWKVRDLLKDQLDQVKTSAQALRDMLEAQSKLLEDTDATLNSLLPPDGSVALLPNSGATGLGKDSGEHMDLLAVGIERAVPSHETRQIQEAASDACSDMPAFATIVTYDAPSVPITFSISGPGGGSTDLIGYVRNASAEYKAVRDMLVENYPKWRDKVDANVAQYQKDVLAGYDANTAKLKENLKGSSDAGSAGYRKTLKLLAEYQKGLSPLDAAHIALKANEHIKTLQKYMDAWEDSCAIAADIMAGKEPRTPKSLESVTPPLTSAKDFVRRVEVPPAPDASRPEYTTRASDTNGQIADKLVAFNRDLRKSVDALENAQARLSAMAGVAGKVNKAGVAFSEKLGDLAQGVDSGKGVAGGFWSKAAGLVAAGLLKDTVLQFWLATEANATDAAEVATDARTKADRFGTELEARRKFLQEHTILLKKTLAMLGVEIPPDMK